jgi:hypothetical protein
MKGHWSFAITCNQNFSDSTKKVVCRHLGCGPLKQDNFKWFTPPVGEVHVTPFTYNCSSDMMDLSECQGIYANCVLTIDIITVVCEVCIIIYYCMYSI